MTMRPSPNSDDAGIKVGSIPLWVGVLLTVLYIAAFGFLYRGKIETIALLDLNNAGDFLAGLFAPLAFLWLVVSLWMQRSELRQNTEVLKFQLAELKATVEHQGEIAWASKAELNKEKPYFFVKNLDVSIKKRREENEYHFHFNCENSGGVIRQAIFELKFPYAHGKEIVNEIAEDKFVVCVRIEGSEYMDTSLGRSDDGTLSVLGQDIHGHEYSHLAIFNIDMKLLNDISETTVNVENRFLQPSVSKP